MNCAPEDTQFDTDSIGPVRDVENIYRGAFPPDHINENTGKIKMGVFPTSQLRKCELSVWRQGEDDGIRDDQLVDELRAAAVRLGKSLHSTIHATAAEIRSISVLNIPKAFCIIDDTVCDPDGRKHEAHANMGFSDTLMVVIEDEADHEAVQLAKQQLKAFMEKNIREIQ